RRAGRAPASRRSRCPARSPGGRAACPGPVPRAARGPRGCRRAGSPGNGRAAPGLPRSRVDELGGREVLGTYPERLEDGELVGRTTSLALPDQDLAELGPDVVGADPRLLDGEEVVAALVEHGLARVGGGRRRRDP